MKRIVSFRDFLRTGTLGPISPGMRMIDVAKELGPPKGWITEHADTIPLYWIFGKLEILFDGDSHCPIDWYQIEDAGYLEGGFEIFTERLVLSLDGLTGVTKPSEFLQSDLWNSEEPIVSYYGLHDDIMLSICAGRVALYFQVTTDFLVDGDAAGYLAQTDLAQTIKMIDDKTCQLDSIYSHRIKAIKQLEDTRAILGWKSLTGTEYLAALNTK